MPAQRRADQPGIIPACCGFWKRWLATKWERRNRPLPSGGSGDQSEVELSRDRAVGPHHWQGNSEGGTHARRALALHRTALGARDSLSDRETESTALTFVRPSLSPAIEAFKNARLLLRRNADALVLEDRPDDAIFGRELHPH